MRQARQLRDRARRWRRQMAVVEPVARWWGRQRPAVRVGLAAAGLAFVILYPLTLSTYWQSVLFFPVGLYVVLALGLNVVVGAAGLLDLGYVAFYAVGAYSTAKLTTASGLTAWEALPIAILIAMVAGVVLGAPTLRLRGDYLAIVTLGFGEIVRIVAQNSEVLGEARGITGIAHPESILGVEFEFDPLPYYYLTLAAIVFTLIVGIRLTRSRVGRAWAAIREDEDAAEAMGVPTFAMKLWAFAMGASTGGLAGWIYASKVGFINPDNFPFFFSVIVLAAVVLGGMGSMAGVVAGAFAIAFLPEYLRDVAAGDTIVGWLNALTGGDIATVTEYRVLLFGLALVAMMVFRPQGLLPSRQRAAELLEATESQVLGAETATPVATIEAAEAYATAAAHAQHASPPTVDVGGADLPEDLVPETAEVVLEVAELHMRFGGVVALDDISIEVRRREIFGIIGPNGAGKTTLFNCVTGVFRPTRGRIRLDGSELVGSRPHQITEAGICRTFQNIRLFPNLTAEENIRVGVDARHRTSVPGALLTLPRHRREERHGRDSARQLLAYVGLDHRGFEPARSLPYGDQRRLEIARALATGPKLLLLDEPAAGMNPSEKNELIALIRRIRDSGLTVVLIEHDMGVVMRACDRIAVLDFGQKIADGPPARIQSDPRVIEAYLGTQSDAP